MKIFTLISEIFTLNFTLIFQVHCGPQWPHRRPQAAHCARRGHQPRVQERDTDADRRTRGAHGRPQVRSRERRGRECGPRRRHHCRVSRRSTGEVRYVSQRVYFSYYHGTVYIYILESQFIIGSYSRIPWYASASSYLKHIYSSP